MKTARYCLLAATTLLFAGAGAAHAEPKNNAKPLPRLDEKSEGDPDVDTARKHYVEGTKAFNLGEFQRAITEYKTGYNAKPDPVFLYNIGQAYRLSGDLNNAVFFYRSFLRNDAASPKRAEVEERITTLEKQIAQQKTLTTMPPNTPVEPGANPSGETHSTETGTQTDPHGAGGANPATGNENKAITDGSASTSKTEPEATPVYKKWWLWTIVGVVVAGGVVGGVVAATASSPRWSTSPDIGPGISSGLAVRW